MYLLKVLYKSIIAPLEVFRKDHIEGRLSASIAIILITALLGSIIAPVVRFYMNKGQYEIHLHLDRMFIAFFVTIGTWLIVCISFWLWSKAFNKDLEFRQVISIWGLSYMPNLICVILYNLLSIAPELGRESNILAFILSSLFIMLLVWKAIYYFVFMRFVINTTLFEISLITMASTVLFVILMMVGFNVGIQVPML
ncbi:YIP1 family protein [Fusibacter ferrireducens]|uniref:Yip1 domain-containing protein n=1 Tax=Fusibacter ferrireducens TaxID=2785058 RepID=A0ABR9ZPV0_9FIRM|nr:YIP1 family protein [Fusibacter ferrireducens]MBF4692492.1 hypothetical protein [Fusibacter ferrireducens]